MSRASAYAPSLTMRFPRVSGDEPALNELADKEDAFSPRERG